MNDQVRFSVEEQARNRASMPATAAWVEERRREWGAAYVNDVLRRAVREKEPDLFWALERGRTMGTPWRRSVLPEFADLQQLAVVIGSEFAAFMAAPGGGARAD